MSTTGSPDSTGQSTSDSVASVSAPTNAPSPVNNTAVANSSDLLPEGVYLTSVGKRFGVYLLDAVLMMVTLGIGWLIWGAITASNGQTPARKILGVYQVSNRDGKPLSWAQMVFMRGIVGAFVMGAAIGITLGILAFMPFWDRNNQTINDKVSGSIAVDDPNRVYG